MSRGTQKRYHGPARELGRALRARLAAETLPLSRSAEEEIRRQVCDCAARLKELGVPPEVVIVAVKQAASDAGIHECSSVLASHRSVDAKTTLLVDIVGWCIAGYYE